MPTHSMNRQRFVLGVGSSLATNTSIHAHLCPPMNNYIATMPTHAHPQPMGMGAYGHGHGCGRPIVGLCKVNNTQAKYCLFCEGGPT